LLLFNINIDDFLTFLESLKTNFQKCVIVVDFTKFGMVDEGNVHCFVVAVLSSSKENNDLYKYDFI